MKLVFNAVASTAGGGKTYLLNLLRHVPSHAQFHGDIWVAPALAEVLPSKVAGFQVRASHLAARGYLGRLFWERFVLPWRSWVTKTDAIVCLGNVQPLITPLPVVLISANALYFSDRYASELYHRKRYTRLLEYFFKREMVLASAGAADVLVTPTRAMADHLGAAGEAAHVLPFGHHQPDSQSPVKPDPTKIKFLIVSFYNYFRNFETVFRGIALLRKRTPTPIQLLLTTDIRRGLSLGGYDTTQAFELLEDLDLFSTVVTVGETPNHRVADLYAEADIVICPGYIESFSFTLVEAMAQGCAVLASDIPAHREVSGGNVSFFAPLDPQDFARQAERLIEDATLRNSLAAAGPAQAQRFSWAKHFEALFRLIESSVQS